MENTGWANRRIVIPRNRIGWQKMEIQNDWVIDYLKFVNGSPVASLRIGYWGSTTDADNMNIAASPGWLVSTHHSNATRKGIYNVLAEHVKKKKALAVAKAYMRRN